MTRWARVLAFLLSGALVVTGITLLLDRRGVIDLAGSDAPALEQFPFPSVLTIAGPSTTTVGGTVPLIATSYGGAEVARVRLFDGAREVARVDDLGAAGGAALRFPALDVGRHLVHVEVEDVAGKLSRSVPVTLTVAPGFGEQPRPVTVQAFADEKATDIAARLGLDARDVVVAGTRATVLVAPDAGIARLGGTRAVVDQPVLPNPARLALTVTAKGCGVALTTSSARGKVTFWHAAASIPGWAEMDTPGRGRATVDLLAAGTHVFHATDDEGVSNQVQVSIPASCAARAGWKGNASIVNGILSTPAGQGGLFLHLSVDGRSWLRIPASPSTRPSAYPGADVSESLPALDGHRLDLEVWETPKEFENPPKAPLATGSLTVPEGMRLADVVGEPSALTLTSTELVGYPKYVDTGHDHRTVEFAWNSASERVDRVVWQVIAGPLDPKDRSLTPPGLLATGLVEATGGTPKDGGRAGTFSIDTAKIPLDPSEPLSGQDAAPSGVAQVLTPPIEASSAPKLTGAKFASIVPVTDLDGEVTDPVSLPREGDDVHVRVLADPTNPWAVSEPLTLRLPTHESKASGVAVTLDEVTLDAGHAPLASSVGCVYVDVPWQGVQPFPEQPSGMFPTYADDYQAKWDIAFASGFYPGDEIKCPGAFKPAECDDLICGAIEFIVDAVGAVVGFVVEVASLVSYAYNGIVSGVVDALVTLNPICAGLGAAGGDQEACAGVARIATRAAVSAALASVGLPPALPSGDALKAAATGEFARLGAELMEAGGIPCDELKAPEGFGAALDQASSALGAPKVGAAAEDPCLAVARLLLETVSEQVGADAQAGIAAASGLPAFPMIKGFTMTPDPRAELQPLRLNVKAHPTKASADGTGVVCSVRLARAGTTTKDPYRSIAPWSTPWVFKVPEAAPIDGQGTWAGGGVSVVSTGHYKDALTLLQPRTVDVVVEPAGGCTFEPRTVSATIAPPIENWVPVIATPGAVVVSD